MWNQVRTGPESPLPKTHPACLRAQLKFISPFTAITSASRAWIGLRGLALHRAHGRQGQPLAGCSPIALQGESPTLLPCLGPRHAPWEHWAQSTQTDTVHGSTGLGAHNRAHNAAEAPELCGTCASPGPKPQVMGSSVPKCRQK